MTTLFRIAILPLFFLFCVSLSVVPAYAGAGDFDTTFGTGGKIIFPTVVIRPNISVLSQSDSKILVGGRFSNSGQQGFSLVRLLSDGSFDTTFGDGGKVLTPEAEGNGSINALALQSDGKILAVGASSAYDFKVARYTTTGSLDATFGTDGATVIDVPGLGDAPHVAVQSDGKIVVAANLLQTDLPGNPSIFMLARFLTDGTLDSSFGDEGIVTTSFDDSATVGGVVVQSDGKIILGGTIQKQNNTQNDVVLVRYTSSGDLDTTYGTGGIVITDLGLFEDANDIALTSDGKVITAGESMDASFNPSILLMKYDVSGNPDTAFGNNGVVISNFGRDVGEAVSLQSDGKIVVTGPSGETQSGSFMLARFASNGSADTSFGNGGIVRSDLGGSPQQPRSITLQPDGKIVAGGLVGFSSTCSGLCAAVARYEVISTDDIDPTITITRPEENATYFVNQTITASFSCQDEQGGSGIASCSATVDNTPIANGAALPTNSAGTHTFKVTAIDNEGNTAEVIRSYNVLSTQGNNSLILPPDARESNAGSLILTRFRLSGNPGPNVFAAGYPKSQQIDCQTHEPVVSDPLVSTNPTTNNVIYNPIPVGPQYIHRWNTSAAWDGTCRKLVMKFAPNVTAFAGGELTLYFDFR